MKRSGVDEFAYSTRRVVPHDILKTDFDAIGDLYLGGHSLIGELRAYKTGHGLNKA